MTFQFIGTLKTRFRLSIFGYDIYAGPWTTQNVNIVEPLPAETATFPLPDGFSASASDTGNGVTIALQWEGVPILSDTIPLTGSLPVSLQPLKGVILAGKASISA